MIKPRKTMMVYILRYIEGILRYIEGIFLGETFSRDLFLIPADPSAGLVIHA